MDDSSCSSSFYVRRQSFLRDSSSSTTTTTTTHGQPRGGGDRFIPVRSAMDMGMAQFLLSQSRSRWLERQRAAELSPYQSLLAEHVLGPNRDPRILVFNENRRTSPRSTLAAAACDLVDESLALAKQKRCVPEKPSNIFDVADLDGDERFSLLDWGAANVLSVALGDTAVLYDHANSSSSELVTVPESIGPITCVSWAPDGRRIALGLGSSDMQLWDSESGRLVRTLSNLHAGFAVGALSWNDDNILTTGGYDGIIVNRDMRLRQTVVGRYIGHKGDVCRLKWSSSGRQLASSAIDGLIHIWDLSMSSSNPSPWIHKFRDHTIPKMALAWCPFQKNLLACCGGEGGRSIKFYNTQTGACLSSVDTGSYVFSLLWSEHNRELLSSHGDPNYQLALWKYPSMVKIKELTGHTSSAFHMTQSPDKCTVASAAAGEDGSLRLWKVFAAPKAAPKKVIFETLTSHMFIRF